MTTPRLDSATLVDSASACIEAQGFDPGTVVGLALLALAESWADDSRPICMDCGMRRVASGDLCGWCKETQVRQRELKRQCWERNGEVYRENAAVAAALRNATAPESETHEAKGSDDR